MSTNGKQSKTADQRDPNSNSILGKLHYYKIVVVIFQIRKLIAYGEDQL